MVGKKDPFGGFCNYGIFGIWGKDPGTGKKKYKKVDAISEAAAVEKAAALGCVDPQSVEVIPFLPPGFLYVLNMSGAYSVLDSAAGASAASCCTAVVAIVAATLAAVVAASAVAALIWDSLAALVSLHTCSILVSSHASKSP